MRILVVTNLYPNARQPHRASFNRQQFAALVAEHEVRIIAPIAWTSSVVAPVGADEGFVGGTARISDGMIIEHPHYYFSPKMLRGWYGQFYLRSIRENARRAMREFRPDVVLGSWAYPDGWAAVLLAREAGIPVAIKVHGSDLLTVGRGAARYRRTVEAITCANAVIAVGRRLGERAIEMGVRPERVHIVHNGIDAQVFHPGPREGARERLGIQAGGPLILFVGNLVPVKGLDVLLNALSRLTASGAPFQCVLVGDGPLGPRLRGQINSLGLSTKVRLVGSRPQSELADWYQAADLLVLPSRSEGIPNVLLEAAACKTPVVASDVGDVSEVCSASGLVPPGDAGALADRIRMFLSSPPLDSSPRFTPGTWRESAAKLAGVLDEIVQGAAQLGRAG